MIGAVPRAIVCLPTYNERTNLEPMIRALLEQLGPDDRVLVIDDNSPDGTGELADRIARARKGLVRPTSPGSAERSPTEPSSCWRWTATSHTPPPTCRV